MHTEKRSTYLIQDPYDDDALKFMRTIFTYFGLRPVCFYTDPKGRYYGEQRMPYLLGDQIEARYDVDLRDLPTFAREVRQRHDVRAVIPYREDTVEVAAELCDLLALDWNAADVIRRFRNKHALKKFVSMVDPGVRVPDCRLVHEVRDVFSHALPARFVIKPNDGFGNRAIGIFATADRDAVAAHLARWPGTTWVLEEYISGVEYHVNGHVRADGEVVPLAVLEYVRTEVNGYSTVYAAERQCRTDHPEFERIVDYARRLLAASGIRRSPFHMEVKVDESGPCMVDIGARFPSEGGGHMLSRLHPGRPDVYAVAAHDYLGSIDFARTPVDWTHYDGEVTVLVYGISESSGFIQDLSGVEAVEALPEFVNWVLKPRIGDRLAATTELHSAPYLVELRHASTGNSRSDALITYVRDTIRWNRSPSPSGWMRARATDITRRALPKLSWLAHTLGQTPAARWLDGARGGGTRKAS